MTNKTDQAELPRITLYDFFVTLLGIKPDPEYVSAFEEVCINSKEGKRYRLLIDRANDLMDTTFDSKNDHVIVEAVANNIYRHLTAPKKKTKKK